MPEKLRLCPPGSDPAPLIALFRASVRGGARRDYTAAELAAWAPEAIDPQSWRDRQFDHTTLVAEADGAPIGFVELSRTGHIAMLYVAPERQGQGIGSLQLEAATRHAAAAGLAKLTVDASLTALALFERRGFRRVRLREVALRGQLLRSYSMEKVLAIVPFP